MWERFKLFIELRLNSAIDIIWSFPHTIYKTFFNRFDTVKIRSLENYYQEVDDLLLHANFQILVDFVEVELAWFQYCIVDSQPTNFLSRFTFRSREYGIKFIEAQINCPEQDKTKIEYYEELLFLYNWWTVDRNSRTSPFQASGYYSKRNSSEEEVEDRNMSITEVLDFYKEELSLSNRISDSYYEEDNLMLKRLIEIRRCLWV